MVHHCSGCPGEEALIEVLRNLFEEIGKIEKFAQK